MDLKLVLSFLVLVQLVVSISYTPDDEEKPKKPGCAPKTSGKRHRANPVHRNNSRYGRSAYGKSRVDATLNELACKDVVAFYDGTFHNYIPNDMKFKFQFRLKYENQRYHGQMEHWEESATSSKKMVWCFGEPLDFNITGQIGTSMHDYYSGNNVGTRDPYNYEHNKGNLFNFLKLESRAGEGVVLTETVGYCTKVNHRYPGPDAPKRDLYKSCVCCGEYNPDPSLGCPENPWATKQPRPDC